MSLQIWPLSILSDDLVDFTDAVRNFAHDFVRHINAIGSLTEPIAAIFNRSSTFLQGVKQLGRAYLSASKEFLLFSHEDTVTRLLSLQDVSEPRLDSREVFLSHHLLDIIFTLHDQSYLAIH